MNVHDILMVAGISSGIITAILGGLLWVIRSQVATLQADNEPNGGKSSKDQLNAIQQDIREIRLKVDSHIDWHLDGKG